MTEFKQTPGDDGEWNNAISLLCDQGSHMLQ